MRMSGKTKREKNTKRALLPARKREWGSKSQSYFTKFNHYVHVIPDTNEIPRSNSYLGW